MSRVLVTLALGVYNNLANMWPPFNRTAYVPANLLATIVLTAVAVKGLGLSPEDLGITQWSILDGALGLALAGAIGLPLLALARWDRGARLVADRRVGGLRGKMLAYQTLIRVPLGTALLEELAFRGVLFAAWRGEGDVVGALVSSSVFGLWHICPAAVMVKANVPAASRAFVARGVAATVLLTTCAGVALVWLRLATGSLAAPFAAHAGVNSLATLAAARASDRLASSRDG